jgi:hypothetical protein
MNMTFTNTLELTESYGDRLGCGDELFLDSRFRADDLIAALETGFRGWNDDDADDDVAGH